MFGRNSLTYSCIKREKCTICALIRKSFYVKSAHSTNFFSARAARHATLGSWERRRPAASPFGFRLSFNG